MRPINRESRAVAMPGARRAERGSEAFTLVELLVVIGIVALLIGLAAPALRGAAAIARDTRQIAHLSQLGLTTTLYARTYRDSLPWAPAGTWFQVSPEPGSSVLAAYWSLQRYWASLYHDVAPWREHFRTWVVPHVDRPADEPWSWSVSGAGTPSYALCRSMFGRPQLWTDTPVADPKSLRRPVRLSEIRFAGSKAMFFDAERPFRERASTEALDRRAILFSDGHAARHRLSEATRPVVPMDAGAAGELAEPLHDTRDGAHGRDY